MRKYFLPLLTLGICLPAFAIPSYGKYDSVLALMQSLQSKHPSSSQIFSIGENDDGTPIMAMRISTAPAQMDLRKIGHLVVGTHHGNEAKAADFSLRFAERTLERYSSTELLRGSLHDIEWTIVPVLNISGYNANARHEHGYDPNRDYPGPCVSAPGGKLKSIRTLMQFLTTRIFAGTVTVHGYIGTLTYPWGVDVANTHTLDHNAYEQITSSAAKLNGYRYGTSTDVVYPADSTYEDYVYWKHGIWSLLLELRDGSSSDIQNTVAAMEYFFDHLDSSPSTKNQLTSACLRSRPDLFME